MGIWRPITLRMIKKYFPLTWLTFVLKRLGSILAKSLPPIGESYWIHLFTLVFQEIKRQVSKTFYHKGQKQPIHLPSLLVFALRMGLSKHDDFNHIINICIISFPITASSWHLGWLPGKDNWTSHGGNNLRNNSAWSCWTRTQPFCSGSSLSLSNKRFMEGFIYFQMGL